MVDKTQRHRNHQAQWTVAEIIFVEQHYGQLSAREMAGLPVGWPGLFSFPVCPGAWRHPGRKRRSHRSGPTIQRV